MRRDTVHQIAHPTLRRSVDHRERDRAALPFTAAICRPRLTRRIGSGRGPAWANSLFEDNAEFGLGFRVSLDKQQEFAGELLQQLSPQIGRGLVTEILNARQRDEADIFDQRERVVELKRRLSSLGDPACEALARAGRHACAQERLDCRRRRMGLRHWLRRTRSCARKRPQRQSAAARHGGLLQHRRTMLQIHATRLRSPSSPRAANAHRKRISD